ncbi:MAG: hypothetical protein IKW00_00070 [Clostridia bacterium]|nr:hypothetical protein [Clostridia bacterium]
MYELKIGRSIGKVALGMKRCEVQQLFDDLTEDREIPFGCEQEIVSDSNSEFVISYNGDECVDFILCMVPDKLELQGESLKDYTVWSLYTRLKELDPDMETDSEGFISNLLGFGISTETCYDEEERAYDLIQSVQVAVKDYWK